jgi:peptidoglycan/LPS O-acetylase OafA/YrhL
LLKIIIPENRIFGLDLLRCFAISMVLFFHSRWLLPEVYKNFVYNLYIDGVTIFFVLSGFLIGTIIIKQFKKDDSLKSLINFWLRRWFRTLPLYYFVLILSIFLFKIFYNYKFSNLYEYFFFIQNFNKIIPDFFGVSWSLTIEEWFYLIIPMLLFFSLSLSKDVKKNLLSISILILIYGIVIRYYRYTNDYFEVDRKSAVNKQVIVAIDLIIYGVLGAWFNYYYKKIFLNFKTIFFILGIVIIVLLKTLVNYNLIIEDSFVTRVFGEIILAFSTLLMLPFLSTWNAKKCFLVNIITKISLISYSLYLIHGIIVLNVILEIIDLESTISNLFILVVVKYLLYLIFSIFLSILSYKYIELPFLYLREKFIVKK